VNKNFLPLKASKTNQTVAQIAVQRVVRNVRVNPAVAVDPAADMAAVAAAPVAAAAVVPAADVNVKCSRRHAANAETRPRCRSNHVAIVLSIAAIASSRYAQPAKKRNLTKNPGRILPGFFVLC